MSFPHIDKIAGYLVGTSITSLELSGPMGTVRLTNGDPRPADEPPAHENTMVRSPGVGRFLHLHPLSRATLVPVGSHVEAGRIVGLLQVGVLLIPVRAPCAGHVAGTLVPNGEIVGFGANLIVLHPLSTHAVAPETTP